MFTRPTPHALHALALATLLVAPGCTAGDEDERARGLPAGPDDDALGGAGAGSTGLDSPGQGADDDFTPLLTPQCPMGSAVATRIKPEIVIVVDGSISMTDFGFRDDDRSRWDVLKSALVDGSSGVVKRFEDRARFGVRVFQSAAESGGLNARSCPYPDGSVVDPLPSNADVIAQTLDNNRPDMPVGTTPTARGLREAYDGFDRDALDRELGRQVVVLTTDGEPNDCVGDFDVVASFLEDCPQPEQIRSCTAGGTCVCFVPSFDDTVQAVEYGQGLGVDTYVLSLAEAGGPFAEHLQALANVGVGMARDGGQAAPLYVPNDPEQLAQQLSELISLNVSCEVTLNGTVDEQRAMEGMVALNGELLDYGDADGWTLVDERTIRAEGVACERFKTESTAYLEASFPCEVFTVD